jgi:hypothetical protein
MGVPFIDAVDKFVQKPLPFFKYSLEDFSKCLTKHGWDSPEPVHDLLNKKPHRDWMVRSTFV